MTTLEKLKAFLADDNNRVTPNLSLEHTDGHKQIFKSPFRPVECADGYTMSVQANDGAYCFPRNSIGPWTHVEVWLCGNVPEFEFSASYATQGEDPYSQVPIEDVAAVIDRHGGFKS